LGKLIKNSESQFRAAEKRNFRTAGTTKLETKEGKFKQPEHIK
jgi:hypothetical protein